MFASFICKLRGHRVNRRRVWHDTINYRTRCERCGGALLRDTNGWRNYDLARDGEEGRGPHPHDES